MQKIAVIALINFNNWDDPDYEETGGVNSVIKNILPYLKADKIILYGITYQKENLFKEKVITNTISVFPIIYKASSNPIPNRLLGMMFGWRLKKHFKIHQINFVYSHSEELAFWIYSTKIPYIHHLHTFVNPLEVSNGKLAKFKVLQQLWETIRYRSIKKSFKSIAINKDIISMLKEIIGEHRIIYFPNYVDAEKFHYCDSSDVKQLYSLQNKKVALFIGRITKVKGMDKFTDIIVELNRIDDGNWIGLIVGNGEFEPALKEYIARQEASNSFIFTGSVNDQSQLSKFYSLANVFLITSLSESVPLTLLESLSCGTPVVSTDVGIAKDVLGLNNGFVGANDSTNEMAKLVLKSLLFKSEISILRSPQKYSVKQASNLLNDEFDQFRD